MNIQEAVDVMDDFCVVHGEYHHQEAWQTLKPVVEIDNSAQQLKAEIAALANELDYFNFHRISKFGAVDEIVAKMRQLSAV
jgi:hypothetical protein